MGGGGSDTLVAVALDRIGELKGDEARETALKALVRAINELETPGDGIATAFDRILDLSSALAQKWCRIRSFADVCEGITVSRLPREQRGSLLEGALKRAALADDAAERIERRIAAIEALIDLRWSDVEETLVELAKAAGEIADEQARARAITVVALAMAKRGDCDRAVKELEKLPASGKRARSFARVAAALDRGDRAADASALLARTVKDLASTPDSYDRSHALRSTLAVMVECGLEAKPALEDALAVADSMQEGRFKKDSLLGAIKALGSTPAESERVGTIVERLEASIDRVTEIDFRAELLGQLGISLAGLGDVDGCTRTLRKVIELTGASKAVDLVDPVGDLPSAVPIPQIVSILADAGCSLSELKAFADTALGMLSGIQDTASVGALLGKLTQIFTSPALPYNIRVALLQGALDVARSMEEGDDRIRSVVRIANAFCVAGATDWGDAMFEGVVSVIGAREARAARRARAVTLVRLGRIAESKAEVMAAAATTGADSWHAIEEIAQTAAKCGLLADMLEQLARVHPSRQSKARAQIADSLAESTYLDPYLRELGLTTLAEGAEVEARQTIECLLAQVRLLEGLGDAGAVLAAAFEKTRALDDPEAAAIYEQQLVAALTERVYRMRV